MNYIDEIKSFLPRNIEEEIEKNVALDFILKNENVLLRDNKIAHMSSSGIILNKDLTKMLMIYHNIYDTWGWTGGHTDGNPSLSHVAYQEALEETNIEKLEFFTKKIYSIDILPVSEHYKNNKYISSHLHINVVYVFIANEELMIKPKLDENKDVKWFDIKDIPFITKEKRLIDIYNKVINYVKSEKKF